MLRFYFLTFLILAEITSYAQGTFDQIYWSARWSPNGKYLAVGACEEILIFDGQTLEYLKKYHDDAHVERVRWHPRKPLLAVADTGPHTRLIDVETDQTVYLRGNGANPSRAVAWNHEGTLVAVADYEGVITVWDIQGQLVRSIPKETSKGYVALDWHPARNEIIALSESIRIYDLEGNLVKKDRHREEEVLMLCVEWHPSGEFFAIGDYGDHDKPYPPLLQFWNENLEKTRTNRHSRAEFRNMHWSPDGDKLATASDALRIWSREGKILAAGPSGEDYLWGVGWSPDGTRIVTSSTFGRIQIWDNKANLIRELEW